MYLIDFHRQNERVRNMVTVRKDEDKMEVYYHDPASGEMWKSFFPRGYNDKNSPKLLRPEPPPSTLEQQINLDLGSDELTNAKGLGLELSGQPSLWEETLEILDSGRKKYSRKIISTFLDHLGIKEPENIFSELGIEPAEAGLKAEDLNRLRKKSRIIRFKRFFGL